MAHVVVDFTHSAPVDFTDLVTDGAFANVSLWTSPVTPGSWTLLNSSLTTGQADPFGGTNAVLMSDSGAGGTGSVQAYVNPTLVTNTDYVFYCYAKASGVDEFGLRFANYDENDTTFFDLGAETVSTEGASHSDSGIIDVGDGWFLCWCVYQSTTDVNGSAVLHVAESGSVTVPLDNTSSVYVFSPMVVPATDPAWSGASGASISAGTLSYDASQASASATMQASLTAFAADRSVYCTFTLSNVTAGGISFVVGDDQSIDFTTNGTHSTWLTPTSGRLFGVEATSTFDGDVDDISFEVAGGIQQTTDFASVLRAKNIPATLGYRSGSSNISTLREGGLYSGDPDGPDVAHHEFDYDTDVTGDSKPFTGSGTAPVIAPSHHTDFHFRMWIIDPALNLANPTLASDIPFRIWNTFPTEATLDALTVTGSSVLSFDIAPLDTILDGQFLAVNMQIAEGEQTIEASVDFEFDLGTGTLLVLAVIEETFPVLPDSPLTEIWEYKTDVLRTYNGEETRLSLLTNPRISMQMEFSAVDYEARRTLYNLISTSILVPSKVPLYQYASRVTQSTVQAGTRLYFDPQTTNLRVGKAMAAVNLSSQAVNIGDVVTLHADGATIDTGIGTAMDADDPWVVVPCLVCHIKDTAGFDFKAQAGSFSLQADAFDDWDMLRPSATETVSTFDSLPIIEKPFLITHPERFAYRREVMDGGVGLRETRSGDTYLQVHRSFKFIVNRLDDEMDYWRVFFDTVRGGQKPFLVSTQLPDLTLNAPITQGASSFEINEAAYQSKLYPLDTFKRIQVTYANGDTSNHTITNSTTDAIGQITLDISPSFTNDPDYVDIDKISFLHRMRASDTVEIEHHRDHSFIKFGARTVNT